MNLQVTIFKGVVKCCFSERRGHLFDGAPCIIAFCMPLDMFVVSSWARIGHEFVSCFIYTSLNHMAGRVHWQGAQNEYSVARWSEALLQPSKQLQYVHQKWQCFKRERDGEMERWRESRKERERERDRDTERRQREIERERERFRASATCRSISGFAPMQHNNPPLL